MRIVLTIVLCLLPSSAFAATYYIDGTLGADCAGGAGTSYRVAERDCGGSDGTKAWNGAHEANSTVAAGDTVYYRADTYNIGGSNCEESIQPGASGTSGSRITYENYNGEEVILDGGNTGNAGLCVGPHWHAGESARRDYVTVKGIIFQNFDRLGYIYYSDYVEIDSCTFRYGDYDASGYNGLYVADQATHLWVHGCTFYEHGEFTSDPGGDDGPAMLNLGPDTPTAGNGSNNYATIENNHFYHNCHHSLGVNGTDYSVIRNNYLHNESWSTENECDNTEKCGYRVMSMTDGNDINPNGNLVEDNFVGYGAQYGGPHLISGASGSGMTVATDRNIVRYNRLFANALYGIRLKASISDGENNRVYNNTFYHHGYQLDSNGDVNEDDAAALDSYRMAFSFGTTSCSGNDVDDNVIKNNLAYDAFTEDDTYSGSTYYPAFYAPDGTGEIATCNTVTNNYGTTGNADSEAITPVTADPLFADPDIDTPADLTFTNGEWGGKPDLNLQAGSPCIDGGTHLTDVATADDCNGGTSCDTTVEVDDARYFQDGSWGSDLSTVNADHICIGTVANCGEISSIDYATDIITMTAGIDRDDGDDVWLQKKSDGEVVLHGAAPDYGAEEFTGYETLRGVSVTGGVSLQ